MAGSIYMPINPWCITSILYPPIRGVLQHISGLAPQYPPIRGVFQTINTGHEPKHITGLVPPLNPNNQSGILFAYCVSTCLLCDTGHEPQHTLPALCHHRIQTIVKLVKSWPSGMPLCTHTHALHGPAPPSPPSLSAHWASLLSLVLWPSGAPTEMGSLVQLVNFWPLGSSSEMGTFVKLVKLWPSGLPSDTSFQSLALWPSGTHYEMGSFVKPL